ncbi:MAG: hypothetical protein A2189_07935 [Paenibacillus sp. RIFOXYA1_FULL_44_5]|nr:MAG: hypothetical protein A2189_07935 [Paenibacillus sp. RIFOXYA1_FULL_44_5]
MKQNMKRVFYDLLTIKKEIAAAILIFAVGIYLGYTEPAQFAWILRSQLDQLKQMSELLQHHHLLMFFQIFINNTLLAILTLFSGVVLIFPIAWLLINGMIIGYLFSSLPAATNVGLLIAKGLLPHGLFELPAIWIASAYGIRFGVVMLSSLFRLVNQEQRQRAKQEIEHFANRSIPMIIFLTIILLMAAIIESTITPWLMNK